MMSQSDTAPPPSRIEEWLRRLILLGPIWYGLVVAYLMARRSGYPFELEWMEGGSLIQVLRVLSGKPVYVPPSLEYIPYIYPPLYYYIAAAVTRLTGLHWLAPLRWVSIVATLGTLYLIYHIVRSVSSSRYWAILGAGLFTASFRLGGAWFDIARVDMLFIFFMLCGTAALIREHRFSGLLAGFFFALAFYTKQTALLPALAALTFLLVVRNWRAALQFAAGFAGPSLLIIGIEQAISRGWYFYYVFHLPSLHQIPQPAWLALFGSTATLLGAVAVAAALALLPFIARPRQTARNRSGLVGMITLAAVAVSVLGNAQPGGYDNANLPALATIPILAGLGGHWIESLPQLRNRRTLLPLLFLLVGFQFIMLSFSVKAQLPTAADREAGEAIVGSLRQTQGEVLVPFHGYLALMAGKAPSAHQVMLWLISGKFGATDVAQWKKLSAEINSALASQRYQRILLDRPEPMWRDVPAHYVGRPIQYADRNTFIPVTGGRTRPNLDYRPK